MWEFVSLFWRLIQRFLRPPAILKAEKALGTRLALGTIIWLKDIVSPPPPPPPHYRAYNIE